MLNIHLKYLLGKNHTIEIRRIDECKKTIATLQELGLSSPKYKWFIYICLFKTHSLFPFFENVTSENYFSADTKVEMHGGVTFFQRQYNDAAELTSVKIGCDYQHYGDDRFGEEEDSATVYEDAKELHIFLNEKCSITN